MIQIHDITMPFPWPDKLVKYYDAPEDPFDCSADEEKWLQAKANAIGCHVFKYLLLASGEYEVHMSAELYRVRQMQYELFAELSNVFPDLEHEWAILDPDHDDKDLLTSKTCPLVFHQGRPIYFNVMRVCDRLLMLTTSKRFGQWVDAQGSEVDFSMINGKLYYRRDEGTQIPATLAYQLYPITTNND